MLEAKIYMRWAKLVPLLVHAPVIVPWPTAFFARNCPFPKIKFRIVTDVICTKQYFNNNSNSKFVGWRTIHTSFSLPALQSSVRNLVTELLASLWSRLHAAMAQHRSAFITGHCKKATGALCVNLRVKDKLISKVQKGLSCHYFNS